MLEVKSYEIFLDFEEKEGTYEGIVKIDLSTNEGVELDYRELEIKEIKAEGRKINFELRNNKIIPEIKEFKGIMEITFFKKIPDSLIGIYKTTKDGFMITTQFEASHARDMFPCIDHPAYKAVFKLKVRISEDFDAISNMPVESIVKEGKKKTVSFMSTPRMSTYLLYLGIGKFDEIKDAIDNKEIIIATPKGKISKAKLPLDFAKKFLKFFEEYYSIPYSLPKLHLIAVPEFAYGAMENWGAITFRETALLVDENSPFNQKRRVAITIAHEQAHLWFGDLVTMKWWDDLWLNESFATLMSYKAVNSYYPDWLLYDSFLLNELSTAFLKDALSSTHPIQARVKEPEEIEQLFDEISYSKGASILRMIELFLGEEQFKKGIQVYLKKFSFSNASGQDLWESLEEASKKGVSRIMQAWITKEGYPYLRIKVDKNKVFLRQERFSFFAKSNDTWPIPLTLEVNGKRIERVFEEKEEILQFDEEIKSIKANIKRGGLYRVFYEDLDEVLKANLSKEEKFGLLNDYHAFFLAGLIGLEEYLSLIKKFFDSDEYLISIELSDQLFNLSLINPKRFKKLAIDFHKRQYEIWRDRKEDISRFLFGRICERLSILDLDFASELSKEFENYESIEPNLKQAVLVSYSISKGREAMNVLLERYRKERFDEERERILVALMNLREPYLTLLAASLVFTGEIKKQDLRTILVNIAKNPYVREAALDWFTVNFSYLSKVYAGTGIFSRLLPQVIPFIGLGREEEVEKFLLSNQTAELTSGIKDSLELLRIYSRISKL